MQTNKFIYEGTERDVLVIEETDNDIFGYDLKLWPEEMKEKLKTTYRHFKKDKIKTSDNVEKTEVEKQKKFEI